MDPLDVYLANIETEAAKDVTRSKEKATEELRRRGHLPRPPRVRTVDLMDDVRDEGLSKAIGDESKGFKMLRALGYEPGKGLGREKQGRATPVEIVVKRNRVGIGAPVSDRKQELVRERKRLRTEADASLPREIAPEQLAAYRAARGERFERSSDARDVVGAAEAVASLDEREAVGHNPLVCPSCLAARLQQRPAQAAGASCASVGADPVDGVDGVDVHDKQPSECPGDTETIARPALGALLASAGTGPAVRELLRDLLDYLRARHHYCMYCGCAFESERELLDKCPGTQRSDH